MDVSPATIAVLLTASGAAIGAAIIQQVIAFLRDQVGISAIAGREKMAAFVCAIVIVIVAACVGLSETPPRYATDTTLDQIMLMIGLVLATYNIGRLAMAIHDDRSNDSTASIRNVSGWRPQKPEVEPQADEQMTLGI